MSANATTQDSSATPKPVDRQLRIWLLVVAAPALVSALWAIFAPSSWYSDFGGSANPSAFGVYNEHFVQDIGGGYLAFAAALIYAAVVLRRFAVRTAVIATLGFTVPHLVVHLIEQGELDMAGYLFVNASLIFGLAVALWCWRLSGRLPD